MYGGDNHSGQQDEKVLTVNETIFKNITSTWQRYLSCKCD